MDCTPGVYAAGTRSADVREVLRFRDSENVSGIRKEHGGIARIYDCQARFDIVEAGTGWHPRRQARLQVKRNRERVFARLALEAHIGDEVGPTAFASVDLIVSGSFDVAKP